MSSTINLKATGLNFSPNALDLPPGSLTKAQNVIIRRENVIEQMRGFKLYGDSAASQVTQLIAYRDRILRQYSTYLQYDSDGEGTFSTFSGTYTQAQTGLRTKSVESNGNLYFTSSEGIKCISAKTNADFTTSSGFIVDAGVPKAVDLTTEVINADSGTTGFLTQDSTVAYRTTWAIKDTNSNLKIGSPSQPVSLYSSTLTLLLQDYMDVLEALDQVGISPVTAAFLSDADYVNTLKLTSSTSAVDLRTKLIALSTKIDEDIRFADDTASGGRPLNISAAAGTAADTVTITFSSGTVTDYLAIGSEIYLSGFGNGSSTSTNINGAKTVTAVTGTTIEFTATGATAADTFTYASGTIVSNEFRSLTPPSAPSTPATAAQLEAIQTYLDSIISLLQSQDTDIITSGNMTDYITPLATTTSNNVRLTVQIPQDVTTDHFLQVYRSTTVTATGTDVLANLSANSEECQLVYEAYPTAAEISAGQMIVDDITPDIFKGANLYTNNSTGEGILQANDVPPFALDVNKFKNYTFYANTKTRHRIIPFNLLGVSNMLTDYDAGETPKITISNGTANNTYSFVRGVQQVTYIDCIQKSSITNGSYFDLDAGNDNAEFRFWLDKGSGTAPSAGGRTLVRVDLSNAGVTTAAQVAEKIRDIINVQIQHFNAVVSTAQIQVTHVASGYVTTADAGTSGFTVTVNTTGIGESISNKKILLSDSISVATAVDETARSMVRVINGNSSEIIYAFYTSSIAQVPGKMVLEARDLSDTEFYVIGNNSNTGSSFFPDISPVVELAVSAGRISVANPTVITSASHGLSNGDQIVITGSNSTPSIDGLYTITSTGTNTFTIPVNVTVAGTKLAYSLASATEVSQNEEKSNRIYYSKLQQPEAVPILNYLDIGSEDQAILRIMPLRDSLFVFKEDGLYRISGETAPFYVSLFDSSCICIAADSVSIANNLVYAFTRQGVSTVSEAGVVTISRPIDTELLKISSSSYTDFSTATWGVGYESDNSYILYTIKETDDTSAVVGYRYSNLTNTWTTAEREAVCGIINPADDKMYIGAGDVNYIEQERKTFSRLDYANREITSTISDNTITGKTVKLASVSDFEVGDVIVQEQHLTAYKFNALLRKLDLDPTVGMVAISNITGASTTLTITASGHNLPSTGTCYVTLHNNSSSPDINGTYEATYVSSSQFQITIDRPLTTIVNDGYVHLAYYETYNIGAGDNLRTALETLAGKLDTDPGLALTNYSTLIANLTKTINTIAVGNPSSITTSASHGLETGRYVTISGSDSSPSINGSWTVTKTGSTTFTIPTSVTTAGTVGTVITSINDFRDMVSCFNIIVANLNTDSGASFSNYNTITDTTSFESVITAINTSTKKITLADELDFVVGPIVVHKAIESVIQYAPNTMGDSLGLKQLREATLMFMNRAFTKGILAFSSDLLPVFKEITVYGSGNGIFGSGEFGQNYFGGASNSAPIRTLIPRNSQRCRYINMKFTHKIARESYSIYGATVTGEVGQSTRAYR